MFEDQGVDCDILIYKIFIWSSTSVSGTELLGTWLVAKGINYVIRGLELSVPFIPPHQAPCTSEEGTGGLNQSPIANDLNNHAHLMRPP